MYMTMKLSENHLGTIYLTFEYVYWFTEMKNAAFKGKYK